MEKDIISNLSDLKSNEKYQCPKVMYYIFFRITFLRCWVAKLFTWY